MGRISLDFTEGGQVTDNLATFDDDTTTFPFGYNNPADPDGKRLFREYRGLPD